jgi:hypothetical protein
MLTSTNQSRWLAAEQLAFPGQPALSWVADELSDVVLGFESADPTTLEGLFAREEHKVHHPRN